MIADSKKIEHERFVSGHSGSTPVDVLLIVSPVISGAALALSHSNNHGTLGSVIIEYITCVTPLIVSFTYMSETALELNTIMMLLLFIKCVYMRNYKTLVTLDKQTKEMRLAYLTSCRATVNLATIIAILAVDFHIFSRRFVKTEEYGYSLMDVGAACYVFMNAITDNKRKRITRNTVRDSLCLLCLGFLRFFAVSITHYQHHVTEYGLHCNFFFSLAFVKIMCSWVPLIPLTAKVFLGSALAFIHHSNLTSGLETWTLSQEPRDNFVAANREWIVSMPGYVEIYLFGAAVGEYLFMSNPSAAKLGLLSLLPFGILTVLETLFHLHPSRRLCNPPFVLWIVSFFLLFLTLYKFVEEYSVKRSATCLIFEAINSYPLMFFLLGNALTGFINLTINTLDVSNLLAYCIINIYVIVLILIVTMLYLRKLKKLSQICNIKL